MLCTSGFTDDVAFGRNGPYGETWRLNREATTTSGVAIPGRSLMSMNALLLRPVRSSVINPIVCASVCLSVCLSASISLEPLH